MYAESRDGRVGLSKRGRERFRCRDIVQPSLQPKVYDRKARFAKSVKSVVNDGQSWPPKQGAGNSLDIRRAKCQRLYRCREKHLPMQYRNGRPTACYWEESPNHYYQRSKFYRVDPDRLNAHFQSFALQGRYQPRRASNHYQYQRHLPGRRCFLHDRQSNGHSPYRSKPNYFGASLRAGKRPVTGRRRSNKVSA